MAERLLICGDLHTKKHILDAVIKLAPNYDKVIFLGDYVDDWNQPPEASFAFLSELLDFKTTDIDKVVLLLGNHDMSEWYAGDFKCSGFDPLTHNFVATLYGGHYDAFQVAYAHKNTLFTHAGVTNGWLKDNKLLGMVEVEEGTKAQQLATVLNRFMDIDHPLHEKVSTLATCGPARGGWHSPSPLWADYTELTRNACPKVSQVVGHTPVVDIHYHAITNGTGTRDELFFCDTHSTYQDGSNIGDNSLLEITDEYTQAITLDGKPIEGSLWT